MVQSYPPQGRQAYGLASLTYLGHAEAVHSQV